MSSLKVLIVEDEELAADRLEEMLHSVDPGVEVIARTGSVKDTARWLTNNTADLIFLDIQLSDGLSFSIFDTVTINTPIIFTTAYDEYAIKAFRVNSIAYLLKPVRESDLRESLKKYSSLKSAFSIDFERILSSLKGGETHYRKRMLIQVGNNYRVVAVDDIAYFFVLDKGVFLRTFSGKTYSVDYSLDSLESGILNPAEFSRINRRYIVNIRAIRDMAAWSRSRIKLKLDPPADNEDDIIVSIERSPGFKKWLNR